MKELIINQKNILTTRFFFFGLKLALLRSFSINIPPQLSNIIKPWRWQESLAAYVQIKPYHQYAQPHKILSNQSFIYKCLNKQQEHRVISPLAISSRGRQALESSDLIGNHKFKILEFPSKIILLACKLEMAYTKPSHVALNLA